MGTREKKAPGQEQTQEQRQRGEKQTIVKA